MEGAVVIEKIRQNNGTVGFNAAKMKYEDMLTAGVVDPTKVVRATIQNAASAASILLTTEAMVVEKPKKESPMPAVCPEWAAVWGNGYGLLESLIINH